MSILQKLTEGIVQRDLKKEGSALLSKWERTGLLEGMGDDRAKGGMARLLENQAKELLREATTMAAGDVEGFAAVAFPIVRRVFGGLIANDLVSVQPMSLPSGLIFFLDFKLNDGSRLSTSGSSQSVYGGGAVGSQVTGGIDLSGDEAENSFYALNQGYASPTGSALMTLTVVASGIVGSNTGDDIDNSVTAASIGASTVKTSLSKLVRYDPDLSGSSVVVATAPGDSELVQLNRNNLISLVIAVDSDDDDDASGTDGLSSNKGRQVRRLTNMVGRTAAAADRTVHNLDVDSATETSYVLVFQGTASVGSDDEVTNLKTELATGAGAQYSFSFPIDDKFQAGGSIGSVVGSTSWGLEGEENIPEIDLKVDSIAVTAKTKKLKAKWTPELGQDLNAYHNLDAEVELTSILSEQIALEIDREILNDLVRGATAATYYWSRMPGMFVERETGAEIGAASKAPDFTGTVSEWYETLVETINDVSAQIHRKTLRGGANYIVTSPEVANILEFTAGFRASVTADADRGTVGAVKTGALSKKWDIYVDPYFPRNVVLVGRKGGSFLESGYVYAPYVPLQVTPTIFGPEDFVPRKGVMTRYAKKMVRPDMYGLVICRGMLGESGLDS